MNKKLKITIIIASILLMAIFFSGCTEDKTKENTVTMSAKELYDDIDVNNTENRYYYNYKSLNDGDTLILQDTIKKIDYYAETNSTRVTFEWTDGTYSPPFQGNITSMFSIGDKVKITVHIKHVQFSNNTRSFDLELFEEQWVSQEYFLANIFPFGGLIALNQGLIEKI